MLRASHRRRASKGIVAVLIAGLLGGLGLVPLTLAASPAQGSAEGLVDSGFHY